MNDRVRQWMLTEDYAKLSVASNTEMKATGATKVSQKQGAALMSAMSLDVDDDLGADIADDFNDYDKLLEVCFKTNNNIFHSATCLVHLLRELSRSAKYVIVLL